MGLSKDHEDKLCAVMLATFIGVEDKKELGKISAKLMINEIFPRWDKENADSDVIRLLAGVDKKEANSIEYLHYGITELTGDIVSCLSHKVISYSQAKKIIADCWDTYVGYDLLQYLCATGLLDEVSGEDVIGVIREVISKNEKAAVEFRSGNMKAIGSIVGAVLKLVKADPKMVQELIKQELTKKEE